MYFVQRKSKVPPFWAPVSLGLPSVEEAIKEANKLDVGTEPEPLRIVDENDKVCAWVPRNGYLPSGALPPTLPHKNK